MNTTEIKLSSGKKVILEEFSMKMTYKGLLVGVPNKQLNYTIIRDIINSYQGKKVVMTLEGGYLEKELLKPYICSARLSAEPKDKEFDGSYMYMVWFGNDVTTITIEKMFKRLNIDWEGEAEDYKF
ncbi:hypothetical protein OX284_011565 [Flavobacterium sp. SUN046]|uniref:hypothetical protein n=1 Tax=Flavobacterium sp. SUN046 TaxID=3002440 RepID=UPI002DB7E59A|nr:hypothetical protein [Flavobacterium sp. SUN046]MEC4050070.1 hypothetical protein [Flavobacterium sp. SUN046]